MVSSWKLNVPNIGVIEFQKVYGTLGQKTYSTPDSGYEKIYYCPVHLTQVLEGRMIAYCEKCNKHYPLKKGGDGITGGPNEPGGVIMKIKPIADEGGADYGDFAINAAVVTVVSSHVVPRSSIDTEFQYYLVPIKDAQNRSKYEAFADMLAEEDLVAITSPILISSRSSVKRVFGIAPSKTKKVLVMTKLLESKYVRQVPDESKFKRMLLDEQMVTEINQAKQETYKPSWTY